MPLEPQVTFKNVDPSDEVFGQIQARLDTLTRKVPALCSCRVVFERPHPRNGHGDRFRVDLVLTLPGGAEVAVSHDATSEHRPDPAAAVGEAFAIAERRLCEAASRRGSAGNSRPGVFEWEQP